MLDPTLCRRSLWRRVAAVYLAAALASGCTSLDCKSQGCKSDAQITAEVRALFSQHDDLQVPNQIEIQTEHRVLYLRGLVSTPYVIELAGELAKQAQGARQVVNLISLDNNR